MDLFYMYIGKLILWSIASVFVVSILICVYMYLQAIYNTDIFQYYLGKRKFDTDELRQYFNTLSSCNFKRKKRNFPPYRFILMYRLRNIKNSRTCKKTK